MDQKENWIGPYIPQGNFIRDLIQQAKLAYSLMLDPRVHPVTKLIPIAAVAYVLLPFDVSPDFVPLLGQIDDLAVLLFGLRLFFEFSPPGVVEEHLRRLVATIRRGDWTVVEETPAGRETPPSGEVVDDETR